MNLREVAGDLGASLEPVKAGSALEKQTQERAQIDAIGFHKNGFKFRIWVHLLRTCGFWVQKNLSTIAALVDAINDVFVFIPHVKYSC